MTDFPYRQFPHRYAGSNQERQSVGDPGHCEACVSVGHVEAHTDLGCGDVGCVSSHDHSITLEPWPGSRNDATGLPLVDWRCSCGVAEVGFDTEDEARDDAEKHLGDADPSEPTAVPPARLRELAAFLENLAESGRFWMPNGTDGERKAGGHALADTAARIEKLITKGTFD